MLVPFNDFSVHIWCIGSFLRHLFQEAQKFSSSLRSFPSRTFLNLHFSFSASNVWASPCASNMYINLNDGFKSHYWAFSNAHSRSGCQNGSTISLISTFSLWITNLFSADLAQFWYAYVTTVKMRAREDQNPSSDDEFLLDLCSIIKAVLHYVVLF